MLKNIFIGTIALAGTMATAPAIGAISINPGTDGALCAPMICSSRFQQVYSAGYFSGPISITSLTFGNTYTPGAMPANNNFTITLSTARRGVGVITTDFAGNAGLDAVQFFTGSYVGGTTPNFTILGNAFNYDPRNGDLLIDIQRNTTTADVSSLYLDARIRNFTRPNSNLSGADYVFTYNPDFYIGVQRDSGLTIGINEAASGVPEPATWAMMLIGFGIAGYALRRRPTISATVAVARPRSATHHAYS